MRPHWTFIALLVLLITLFQQGGAAAGSPIAHPAQVNWITSGSAGQQADIQGMEPISSSDPVSEIRSGNAGNGSGVQPALTPGKGTSSHHAAGLVHLIKSHITAVVRPVSTVSRLISLVVYTGLDAMRSTPRSEIPEGPPPRLVIGSGMNLEKWEKDLDTITQTNSSMGTMELLIDGDEFFPRLEKVVADAERSIDLQIYIFDNDDYALDFGKLLKDRSEKVDVRVVMDGLGSIMAGGVDHGSLPEKHTPPSSLISYLEKGSRVNVRKLPNPWFTFDHTKSIVVDERTAFVGGMNIGREYRYVWHDMMVQIKGPVVGTLQEEFNRTWNYAGLAGDLALITSYRDKKNTSFKSPLYPIRVLKTGIGRSQIYKAQLAAIKRARSYIYIENPYLSDDVILHELIMARHRGVDVRVIIPLECNWKAMHRSNSLAANEMLANGIKVYQYLGMSHVKAVVIDGWACLGSANLDKASFRFNREINLSTSAPEFVDELVTRLFKKDFDESILLTEFNTEERYDRLYEMVADLM